MKLIDNHQLNGKKVRLIVYTRQLNFHSTEVINAI